MILRVQASQMYAKNEKQPRACKCYPACDRAFCQPEVLLVSRKGNHVSGRGLESWMWSRGQYNEHKNFDGALSGW